MDEDLSKYGTYVSGGMAVEEKQPKQLTFKTLKARLGIPPPRLSARSAAPLRATSFPDPPAAGSFRSAQRVLRSTSASIDLPPVQLIPQEAIAAPGEFLLSDFSKLERSPLLHLAFQALDQFRKEARDQNQHIVIASAFCER